MLEITSTRHNPMVDPGLHVWGWEIPVYLFLGGVTAGMLVLAGIQMLRVARGDTRGFAVQTPLLGFVLINIGMLALFLDLEHKLFVWRVYTTFEPMSPMSWGSWVLLLVYGLLAVSALIRLDEAWPWLGQRLPGLRGASEFILARPGLVRMLGILNIGFGIALGIYTGILLSTMVARPLWNSAILGPLFLVSGLSAAAATVHLASALLPGRPAPRGMVGGALAAMVQPLTAAYPSKKSALELVRTDQIFLAAELVLLALLLIGLLSSNGSQIEAARLLLSGPYALLFWVGVVIAGVALPLGLQALELANRVPHTVIPAVLVLAGGFVLRWVLVNAGQASQVVAAAGT